MKKLTKKEIKAAKGLVYAVADYYLPYAKNVKDDALRLHVMHEAWGMLSFFDHAYFGQPFDDDFMDVLQQCKDTICAYFMREPLIV